MAEEQKTISATDESFINRITVIVDDNLQNEALSSVLLADSCCLCQRHFSRRVKQITGRDVTHFIRSRKIKRACELLKSTKLQVSEIYVKCGFESANYFSRVFREEMGMTPTQFRNQENNNN